VRTVDINDIDRDSLSTAVQSHQLSDDIDSCCTTHLKCLESKQDMNEAGCASDNTQNTGKCHRVITVCSH